MREVGHCPAIGAALRLQPTRQGRDDMSSFVASEHMAARDAMPLLETTTTAGRRRVLRNEDGMAPKWSLPAVVLGNCRCETSGDEGLAV